MVACVRVQLGVYLVVLLRCLSLGCVPIRAFCAHTGSVSGIAMTYTLSALINLRPSFTDIYTPASFFILAVLAVCVGFYFSLKGTLRCVLGGWSLWRNVRVDARSMIRCSMTFGPTLVEIVFLPVLSHSFRLIRMPGEYKRLQAEDAENDMLS